MRKRLFSKSSVNLLGLIAFVSTGGGLIISALINERIFYKSGILIVFGFLFAISLSDHVKKLMGRDDKNGI